MFECNWEVPVGWKVVCALPDDVSDLFIDWGKNFMSVEVQSK